MNDLLKEITLRVLISGILCTAALIIAGEGAPKEPVRICCAALIIITLVTPLTGNIKTVLGQIDYSDDIQDSIAGEIENANNAEYRLACDNLRTSMQARLNNAGVECDIRIDARIVGTDFHITSVQVVGELDGEQTERVINILGSEYGVSNDMVMFSKELT